MSDMPSSSRHPFEVFLLLFGMVSGLITVFGDADPNSIEAALTQWQADLWGLGLASGCTVAFSGVWWPHRAAGLIIEQVGLVIGGCAAIFYAVIAVLEVGLTAIAPVGLVAGFGVACFIRWWQIQKVLRGATALVARRVHDGTLGE